METHVLSSAQVKHLLARDEGHFLDNKSIGISAAKLTRSLSAFANADGGELLVGIAELSPGKFGWQGFARVEAANGHIQHLEETFPYGGDFEYEFLSASDATGFVFRLRV